MDGRLVGRGGGAARGGRGTEGHRQDGDHDGADGGGAERLEGSGHRSDPRLEVGLVGPPSGRVSRETRRGAARFPGGACRHQERCPESVATGSEALADRPDDEEVAPRTTTVMMPSSSPM